MSLFFRSTRIVALAGLLALAVGNVSAQVVAEDRAACDQAYKPQVGQEGKDVVWVPTPDEVVQRMHESASEVLDKVQRKLMLSYNMLSR